jgi:hypothetical protein
MNITTALNQRSFLIPRADFISSSQEELINIIFSRHGEKILTKIKLIDENDDYDSFLVEVGDRGYCLKISFDQVPIFYDFMVLKGIEHLELTPQAIDRNEIEYGKTIYYTIQTFEYSENLMELGGSSILDSNYSFFNYAISKLHSYEPPKQVWPHLDDTKSYLEYHNINFNNISSYVDSGEENHFEFAKTIYAEIYKEMMDIFNKNETNLKLQKLVHGNLDLSTIISNSQTFKFINFENAFVGSPFFDLVNLVFELQMNGLKEYDFITKKIKETGLVENRFKAAEYLNEYKICKQIWNRKKLLDTIRDYAKEVIVLNSKRFDKITKLSNNFSKNFYRFSNIKTFEENKQLFIEKFSELILDK